MRSKGGLESDLLNTQAWGDNQEGNQRYRSVEFEKVNGQVLPKVNSISGLEPNKMFVNQNGLEFADVSLRSGTDSKADGRCFSIWDFDHDGLQDIALISMNEPHLQIYRNRFDSVDEKSNGFVAIRVFGGNVAPAISDRWSNRDGFGAKLIVNVGDKSILRELRCGEGFSSQNSSALIVGLGGISEAKSVEIRWPSGVSQKTTKIKSGSLVTFYENPEQSPNKQAFLVGEYPAAKSSAGFERKIKNGPFDYELVKEDGAQLRVFTTMATWCASCKIHNAPLAKLKTKVNVDGTVAFYGLPVDTNDSIAKLKDYADRNQVPYQILHQLTDQEREFASSFVAEQLRARTLPCSIITDRHGRVLDVQFGIPTVSDIRRLQRAL